MNQQESMTSVNVLEVSHDFFMEFNPWKQPTGTKKTGERSYKQKDLTYLEFKKRVGGLRFDEKPTFIQKLKSVFFNE